MTAVPLSHSVGVAGEAAGRPREVLAHPLAFQLDGAFDLGLKLQVAPEGGVGKAADQGTARDTLCSARRSSPLTSSLGSLAVTGTLAGPEAITSQV